MAFKMKGSPARMGTIKGTAAHRSVLRQVTEEKKQDAIKEAEKKKDLGEELKKGRKSIKDKMDWKYGRGEFSSKEKRRLPGESKFQYDVRMRQEKKSESISSSEKGVLEQQIIDKSDLTEGERLELGENIIPEAPEAPVNPYGTGHDWSDWSKTGSEGYSLHELVKKRNELQKTNQADSEEYTQVQAAINAAKANKGTVNIEDIEKQVEDEIKRQMEAGAKAAEKKRLEEIARKEAEKEVVIEEEEEVKKEVKKKPYDYSGSFDYGGKNIYGRKI